MFKAPGKHHLLDLKKRDKKETILNETQKRQLRKQIEAQKGSGKKARTKIEDKTSQEYETIEPSASEYMFKHYLEKCRCGSNHNFHNKRTHLINSNDSDLGTEVVRTVYYIRLDILHRNKSSTNLVKCNRKDEIQTIQRIHRFAIHNKRPNMIKYWDNKCNTGHNHTHNIASVHMHIEYGIRRAEIRKTQPEKQILVGISILPNLCRDIDFGKVSRKRPELRQHHEHGDTTLRRYTTN